MTKLRLALALSLLLPAPLLAQSRSTISSFVGSDGGVSRSPVMVGVTGTREQGRLGVRVGLGIDAMSTPLATWLPTPATPVGVWSADMDGVVLLGNPAGDAPVPYLFAGVGGRVIRDGSAAGAAAAYGYGAGLRTPVMGPLGMEGEIRYRSPVANGTARMHAAVSAGWEARVGLTLARVGARRKAPAAPAVLSAPRAAAPAAAGSAALARRRLAAQALDTADDFLGVRYKWGGNGPDEGFDCSGFVRFVFARHGVALPRVSRDQARAGTPLPLEIASLEPGDLLAFASRGTIDHIAIYAGQGRIIHSSSSGGGVRVDDLYGERGRWYREHMVAARRVIDEVQLGMRE